MKAMTNAAYAKSFNNGQLWNSKEGFKTFFKAHLAAVGSNAERQVRFAVEAVLYFYAAGDRGIWIINAVLEAAYVGGIQPKDCLNWLRDVVPHQTTSKAYEVVIQTGPNKGGSRKIAGLQFTGKSPGKEYPQMEDVESYLKDKPNYMDVEKKKKDKALASVSDLLKSLRSNAEKGDSDCQAMAKIAISAILKAKLKAENDAEQAKIDAAVAVATEKAKKEAKAEAAKAAKAKAAKEAKSKAAKTEIKEAATA